MREGVNLPEVPEITPEEARSQYEEQMQALTPDFRREVGLEPITADDIEGVCECGYVKVRDIPTPIPKELLSGTSATADTRPAELPWQSDTGTCSVQTDRWRMTWEDDETMKCHKCGCMDLEYIGVADIPQGVFHS